MTDVPLLVLVVVTALAFDFTNGFHDTANAMATSIATGALKPKAAVPLSAVLNLVGAFLSRGRRDDRHGHRRQDGDHACVVFAGLVGGDPLEPRHLVLGLPSSSSHALIGGLVGAVLASAPDLGASTVGGSSQGRDPGGRRPARRRRRRRASAT